MCVARPIPNLHSQLKPQHQQVQQQQQQQIDLESDKKRSTKPEREAAKIDGDRSAMERPNKKRKLTLLVVDEQREQEVVEATERRVSRAGTSSTLTESSSSKVIPEDSSRTKQYLRRFNDHTSVQTTCDFFLKGLAAIHEQETQQQQNAQTLYSQQEHFDLTTNLMYQKETHRQKFMESTASVATDAKETIELKQSMIMIESSVLPTTSTSQSTSSVTPFSSFSYLNQGVETSKALLDTISSFVGVPTNQDVMDCQELLGVISNMVVAKTK